MTLDERLESVAILGAGGKMGSGISLLLAKELTRLQLQEGAAPGQYRLTLMDISAGALEGLKQYLRTQALRYVQKGGEALAASFPHIPAAELEARFVATMMELLHPVTTLAELPPVRLVFEAILEKADLKTRVYRELRERCPEDTFFLSNTSSIPLKTLDEAADLGGRIIGFHFYNPPAVQKLVELIIPQRINPRLPELSRGIGKRLGKIIIPANDLAGFIGNGHFIRDGLHGIAEAERLHQDRPFVEAVYAVNRISQDFLIRPMGIFQLIDYVGLDIFQSILTIMAAAFPQEELHSGLIDRLVSAGVSGGQFSDGSQKDGFFSYAAGQPAGIYDPQSAAYLPIEQLTPVDVFLGDLPAAHQPWKQLSRAADREAQLETYFAQLRHSDTSGAQLARDYLRRSKEIGRLLVDSGVANRSEDVNGVLMNGFFHLYGPINDYI